MFSDELSHYAVTALERLGVTVLTSATVTDISDGSVRYRRGNEAETELPTHTVLCAAGNQASPLAALLAKTTGAELDRSGRIKVTADLSLANHPNVFVVGDMAQCLDAHGKPLPALATVAIQQGKFVARVIRARLEGKAIEPFVYRDPGSLATLGRGARSPTSVGPT